MSYPPWLVIEFHAMAMGNFRSSDRPRAQGPFETYEAAEEAGIEMLETGDWGTFEVTKVFRRRP